MIDGLVHQNAVATSAGRSPTQSVLVVGTGARVLDRIREADPEAAITLMCRVELVSQLPAAARADRVIAIRHEAPDAEWVRLAAAAHAAQRFTQIGTFGELDQDRAALIGEALGIPTYSPSTVRWVHDKLSMRRRLSEAAVEDTPAEVVEDPEGLLAFVAEHGLPCVVKPVQGVGSVGITVAREASQLPAAFALASRHVDGVPDAGVLVERFHEGVQYSAEAVSEAGEHQVVAVTRKFSDPESWVELGHVVPSGLGGAETDQIGRYVARILDALGITFGPTHTEIVMTSTGPRVIETHIRLAGDEIPSLVRGATGVDLAACVARQTLGHAVLPELRSALRANASPTRYEAIWFALPSTGGTVVNIERTDRALPEDRVTITELLGAGDEITHPANSDSRIAFARANAESAVEAISAVRRGAEAIQAVVRVPTLSPEQVV